MENMFITPIREIGIDFESFGRVNGQKSDSSVFKSVFENAIKDVKTTEQDLVTQEFLLATGQIDDAHTVPIAASKAQMSVDLLVSLRAKALEAYNELIRIGV